MQRVVPDDQSFDDDTYTSLFRFRFWRYGEWIEVTRYKWIYDIYIGYIYLLDVYPQVVVDDYIPLRRTHDGSLEFLFTHSMDEGEVWPCLLEKAYAKLEGKYLNNIQSSF